MRATGGGGRVGLVLISPLVEPVSVQESGYYNHFTLLLTIEELFGLERLGYAKEEALTPFDSSVFNGASQPPAQSSRISSAVSRPSARPAPLRTASGQRADCRNRPSDSASSIAERCMDP